MGGWVHRTPVRVLTKPPTTGHQVLGQFPKQGNILALAFGAPSLASFTSHLGSGNVPWRHRLIR